jgi:hypothetical protein
VSITRFSAAGCGALNEHWRPKQIIAEQNSIGHPANPGSWIPSRQSATVRHSLKSNQSEPAL